MSMQVAGAVLFTLLWQSPYAWCTGAGSQTTGNSQMLVKLNHEAENAITAGHFGSAIQLIEQGLRIDPTWKEGLWRAGLILYQRDRYAGASNYLRRLARVDPKNGAAWALKGMSEFQLHQFRAAIADIERAHRLGIPVELGFAETAMQDRIIAYIELGDFGTAVDQLNELVRNASNEDTAEREQIITLFGYASLQQSTLRSLTPDQTAGLRDLGEARYASAKNDPTRAKTILEALIQKYPSQPMLHYTYGSLLISWSDYAAAEAQFRAELAIDPSSFATRIALAYLGIETRKTDQALPYALEAAKMRPNSFHAHFYLGRLFIAAGQLAPACHELETARDLSPSNTEVRYILATQYRRMGRTDEAHRELKKFESLKKLETVKNDSVSARPSSPEAGATQQQR